MQRCERLFTSEWKGPERGSRFTRFRPARTLRTSTLRARSIDSIPQEQNVDGDECWSVFTVPPWETLSHHCHRPAETNEQQPKPWTTAGPENEARVSLIFTSFRDRLIMFHSQLEAARVMMATINQAHHRSYNPKRAARSARSGRAAVPSASRIRQVAAPSVSRIGGRLRTEACRCWLHSTYARGKEAPSVCDIL